VAHAQDHSQENPAMSYLAAICLVSLALALGVAGVVYVGLPVRSLPLVQGALIGAESDAATDATRADLFSGAARRVVPFQMLYPAKAKGTKAAYVPDAAELIAAISRDHGWTARLLLGRIGTLVAPWTAAATPASGGPWPVVLYLPGVTGYMQMGSFQTSALAARGYGVVTLNQPGAVAVAVLPGDQAVAGMTRETAAPLIAPSYRVWKGAMPPGFAADLTPEDSIVPYLARDVPLVLDRLAEINANPSHPLHGMLDLGRIGVMGMSLGAIVTAEACALDPRIRACLMMDAPVPTRVAKTGLRQAALWISRPAEDQRLERTASGGWPEDEIAAQAATIAEAVANSDLASVVMVQGLFHFDFTDLPAIQPLIGWLGQSGPIGAAEAHRQINELTSAFFSTNLRAAQPPASGSGFEGNKAVAKRVQVERKARISEPIES
jgi:pimeloyl-ACP methyl ester carboxylesterase